MELNDKNKVLIESIIKDYVKENLYLSLNTVHNVPMSSEYSALEISLKLRNPDSEFDEKDETVSSIYLTEDDIKYPKHSVWD